VRLWNPCQTGARCDGFACIALARHGPTTHDGLMIERERSTVQSAPLDDVSKSIIEQLQEDGRRPYATIAAAVGLSEAAVRQRVQRLLDANVMDIVAVTDPTTLGFLRWAMVGMRVEGDLQVVADALAA